MKTCLLTLFGRICGTLERGSIRKSAWHHLVWPEDKGESFSEGQALRPSLSSGKGWAAGRLQKRQPWMSHESQWQAGCMHVCMYVCMYLCINMGVEIRPIGLQIDLHGDMYRNHMRSIRMRGATEKKKQKRYIYQL